VPDERESDDLFEDLDKFFAPIKDVEWEERQEPTSTEPPEEEHVDVRPSDPVVTVPTFGDEDDTDDDVFGEPAATQASFPGEDADEQDEGDGSEWYDTAALETVEDVSAGSDDVEPTSSTAAMDDDWPGDAAERPSAEELEEAAAHFAGSSPEPDMPASARVVQIDEDTADDLLDELGGEPARVEPYGDLVGDDVGAVPYGDDEEDVEEEDVFAAMADEEPSRVVVGAEGLGGPSWQEPAAVEVGADLDRRGPDRDVPAAFLTGIALAGVAVVALLIGDGVFGVFAALVALVAQGELYGVMVAHHRQPATAVGLVSGALILAGAYFHGEAGLLAMLILGLLATFLWFMTVPPAHRKDTSVNVGLTLLGMAWIPVLAGTLLIILADFGADVVIAVVGLAFVFDTAAFLVGSIWGGSFVQRPLAPATSPKKSVEGTVVATLITVVVSFTVVMSFVDAAPGIFDGARLNALLLGLVVSLAATFGDLAESLIKRDLGVKDMGSVLPGHGGVLDRIDSLLFVAPAALLFLRVIAP
jgi:phosphatidate cytidylyltransferase